MSNTIIRECIKTINMFILISIYITAKHPSTLSYDILNRESSKAMSKLDGVVMMEIILSQNNFNGKTKSRAMWNHEVFSHGWKNYKLWKGGLIDKWIDR